MPKSINNSTNNLTTGEAKLLVLLIGVDRYQDEGLHNLNFCAKDSRQLGEAIATATKLFPQKQIVFYDDSSPNKLILNNVRRGLDDLVAAAGELDTVLIYFSGHGILEPDTKQPFLCLEDTNTEDLINTGLPVRELLAKLAASGAKYQLLFLDACHSGGVNFQDLVAQRKGAVKNESLPVNPTPELINLLQQRASKSQGFYALLSCDKNQRSLELPQLQHGLFTYYLIRAFLGEAADKKGVITADALYQYVYRELIAYIDKNNYQIKLINQQKRSRNELEREPYEPQVPRRIVEGAGEFILGFIPGVAGGNNFGKNDRLGLIVNAVSDCEEVVNLAGILSSRGGFEMDYFSGGVREALRMQHRSWGDALGAIKRCLRWEERSRQDFASACSTAFLYFRAAMETSPEGESYLLFGDGARLSQTALRKLLRNSKMGRVAIALDCPDACQTDLDEWVEDLRGAEIPSLCLLAVAPKSENSGEFAAALGRVLADAKAGFTVAEAIASLQREIKAPPFSTDKTLPPPFPTDKTLPPPFSTDKTLPPPFSRGAGGDRIPFTPWLSGGIIELLLPEGKTGVTFDSGIPPYRGLLAFRKKDAFYFHGRETLAREIVTRLQGESFLAVVGASGSGKSSVVQAGALPLLEAGTQLPGKCWTLCLRPGREPLCSLARALASSPGEAKRLEGLLHLGVDNFVWELQQREEPTVVLVVDQFEELFALAGELERREFLTLLLGALARMPHRLKVVITLRDDFISACLEVRELAARVQESFLLVRPSLEEEEYRRAIVEPARKVGLSLEEGLVETLLAEVRDAGLALPLLQFALQQLWECRQGPTLTLQLYHERVGGLKGVLEKRADEVLGQFGEEERECARWIFLSLVRLGEGREDTRRRVLRSELLVDKYDKGAMMWVLRRLSEERLVIVGGESPQAPRGAGGSGDGESGSPEAGSPQAPLEKGGSGVPEVVGSKVTLGKGGSGVPEVVGSKAPLVKGGLGGSQVSVETPKSKTTLGKGDLEELEVSVEIAHEILIRHWSTLRWWLEENRTRLQQQRQAEGEGKKWERQGRSPDFLPRGAALRQAEELYLKYAEELSPLTREFVEEAMRLEKREEMARRQQRQRTISGLVGGLVAVSLLAAGAVWQWRRAVVGERNAEISARMATLESLPRTSLEQQLDVIALGKELGQDWVSFENRVRGTVLLQQTFDFESWKESNRLKGHQLWVSHVTFSPDGNLIATASSDNTVRLWKPDGTKVATLKGHQAPVSHVTFSPDSNLIATASDDETVRLWKPDGTKVATLKGHTEPVWQVTFSPDGNLIATASDDETARLWKPDGTKVATLKGHTEPVWQVTFSPDGNLIATASDDETVRLWKLDGTKVATLKEHQASVNHVTFSPDGNLIATASDDETARLWKPDGTAVATLGGHQASVNHVTFSPDGNLIATASDDETARLWKPDGTKVATLKGHQASVRHVTFSPDGNLIATASYDETVRLWKPDGTAVATLKGHQDSVRHVTFSPDGNLIATASDDETVRLWKLDGTKVATLKEHTELVYRVTFSPDGNLIATASGDETARLWKLDGTAVATLGGHQDWLGHVTFSPDGNLIATASRDKTVRLWKPDGTAVATLGGHQDWVSHVTFSPDGNLIATASGDNTARLWKLDGTKVATLKGHQDWLGHVTFSPDGNLIATASNDKTARLWKPDGTAVATLGGHQASVWHVTFSPDGNLIATASRDKTARLWKPDGTKVATLKGHTEPVSHVTFSPEGNLIATTSWDNTARLWKLDGTAVATLKGHQDSVYRVTFSPEGNLIATASNDKTARLWNLDLDPLLIQACDWVGDYLTNNPNVSEEEKRLCN